MDLEVLQATHVANMLGISRASLRALTRAGAIGHVRLRLGTKRQRVGYTPARVEEFILSRSTPPKPRCQPEPTRTENRDRPCTATGLRTARSKSGADRYQARTTAEQLLDAALARGDVVRWTPTKP